MRSDTLLDILLEVLRQGGDAQYQVRLELLYIDRDILQGLHTGTPYLHGSYRGSLRHEDVESYHVGEAMVQREYYQRTPRIVYIHASERLLHVRRIVAVGEDHAFRIGGRAGGIGDGGVIIVAQRLPDRQELL